MNTPTHRPTVPGTVLAVTAGILAVALVIDTPAQWRALWVLVVGLALAGGARAAWTRQHGLVAALLACSGVLLGVISLSLAATRPSVFVDRLELLPGMVGLAVLVAGLLPVRAGRERILVTAGAALLFVGVVTSGVVRGASTLHLLAAGVATVLAWDLADQAVSLGGQLGRQATTHRAELVHAGGTTVAGAAVVGTTVGVSSLNVAGLSLTGFAVLLVAGFVLVLSLRH